jgi:hypothetical protein
MSTDSEGTIQERREADLIRSTERERLRALVTVDMDIAHALHADEFQLITPGGEVFSKDEYLSAIACGELKYLIFEPDSVIAVRLYGLAADGRSYDATDGRDGAGPGCVAGRAPARDVCRAGACGGGPSGAAVAPGAVP